MYSLIKILLLFLVVIGFAGTARSMNRSGTAKCDEKSGDDFVPKELRARLGSSWYDGHFRALGEIPLCEIREAAEVYRFVWLRTFHKPIAIRIEKRVPQIRLFVKQTDGAGGYDAGNLTVNRTIALWNLHWEHFQERLRVAGFFKQPQLDTTTGLDGAQWILEGLKNRQYYIDDRWTPSAKSEHAKFREACLYLLSLSGLPIEAAELY